MVQRWESGFLVLAFESEVGFWELLPRFGDQKNWGEEEDLKFWLIDGMFAWFLFWGLGMMGLGLELGFEVGHVILLGRLRFGYWRCEVMRHLVLQIYSNVIVSHCKELELKVIFWESFPRHFLLRSGCIV